MRITYVITKSVMGGAQRYVLDLASYGKQNGDEVSVITGGNGPLTEKLGAQGAKILSLPYLKRDISLLDELRALKDLYRIFKNEKPDIVHVNSSKTGGIGAVAARLYNLLGARRKGLGARIIFTAHGWPFNEPRALWARGIIWFFSWLTVIFSHKTIVLTSHDFRQAKKMPFVKNKIVLIPNGIETFVLEAREFARDKIAPNKKKGFWIGYVGEFHNLNKGVNYLVEAFADLSKKHPETTLVLVGEGQDRQILEEMVASFGLGEKVVFAGHIDDARTLLEAFDIFAIPSLKEGLPYVLLEAGIAGLPSVAAQVGGIPDIIENNRSGLLIEPRNSKLLSRRMSLLLKNTGLRKFLGQNLRKRVKETFTSENMRQKTYDLYKKYA